MKMIPQAACELLEKGESFVLATIVSHAGSTPRTSGSKMIVTAGGRGIGTIGADCSRPGPCPGPLICSGEVNRPSCPLT
jgi:xanthine/CO dehydrogenase XdhC/CoxF family maturation factor